MAAKKKQPKKQQLRGRKNPPPARPPEFPDASRARARAESTQPPPPREPGRPTKRTPELERELLEWTSDGGTLRAFCRQPGKPHHDTVYDWFEQDPELEKRFDKARRRGGKQMLDEMIEIADTQHAGEIRIEESVELDGKEGKGADAVKVKVPGKKTTTRTEDMLGHRKLQIEARRDRLKVIFPEWFTKKLDVDHKSGGKAFDELLREAMELPADDTPPPEKKAGDG